MVPTQFGLRDICQFLMPFRCKCGNGLGRVGWNASTDCSIPGETDYCTFGTQTTKEIFILSEYEQDIQKGAKMVENDLENLIKDKRCTYQPLWEQWKKANIVWTEIKYERRSNKYITLNFQLIGHWIRAFHLLSRIITQWACQKVHLFPPPRDRKYQSISYLLPPSAPARRPACTSRWRPRSNPSSSRRTCCRASPRRGTWNRI